MSDGHWGRGHHNHHRHQRYSSYSEFKKQKEKRHHPEDRRYQPPDGWVRHRDHYDRWHGSRGDPEPERECHRSNKDRDRRYHDKWSELKVKRELPTNDCDDSYEALPNHKKIKVETDDISTNEPSITGKPSSTSTATSFSLSKKHRHKEGGKKYAKEKFKYDKHDKEAWKRLKEKFDKRKRKHKDKRFKEKKRKQKQLNNSQTESMKIIKSLQVSFDLSIANAFLFC